MLVLGVYNECMNVGLLMDFLLPQHRDVVVANAIHIEDISSLPVPAHALGRDTIVRFGYQDSRVKSLIRALKYRNHTRSAKLLAKCLHDILIEELSERQQFFDFIDPLLIPVPLHRKKYKKRGFNQSELLARELAQHLKDLELNVRCLTRTKNTQSQTKQSREERFRNLKDAFTVVHPELIKNRNVLLLDDVITTGATLEEAHRTLQGSGVRSVLHIAIAH